MKTPREAVDYFKFRLDHLKRFSPHHPKHSGFYKSRNERDGIAKGMYIITEALLTTYNIEEEKELKKLYEMYQRESFEKDRELKRHKESTFGKAGKG